MKNEKKDNLLAEHLRKIKYRVDYKINESPKYRPLVNDNEEFDAVPDSIYATKDGQPMPTGQGLSMREAGDQEDAPKPEGQEPPAPSNDQPQNADAPQAGAPVDAPVPPFDKTGGNDQLSPEGGAPVNPMGDDMIGGSDPMGAPDQSQEVDTMQNDIIKHNIEAMKSIHDKLESLDANIQELNAQSKILSANVEEVREPTNTEKLMSKKNVSYPYYFNLNDFWNGNWFTEQREKEHEKGINELPDGTFVADFDDLPQKSKIDVQNSFNEIN
jgi:hypothetical protein